MTGQSLTSDATSDALALVDLDRYPLHDLDGEIGKAFVEQCRAHMAEHGWCNLDGFLRPEALDTLAREANDLLPQATHLTIARNIYGHAPDPNLPEGHPGRREYVHHALQLADDQISAEALVKRLYHCDALTAFIGQVQGKSRIFRSADEFQAVNIVAIPAGGWHGWHYDHDECVVTILLQAAERGGEFVFLPNCRTRESEDTKVVEGFLDGDMTDAKSFGRSPGTLTVFRGEFSLHGVTKVEGCRPRISAIFTYDEEPGRVSSDEINIRIYGPRAKRILAGRRGRGGP